MMGIIYNNRIYIRNIHATLYNVGANQHIILPLYKIENPLFQFMPFQLSVGVADRNIRTKTLYHIGHFG